jgi:hypothetical protein
MEYEYGYFRVAILATNPMTILATAGEDAREGERGNGRTKSTGVA